MKTFKSITLTVNKNKKIGDNLPDYKLSTKDGEDFIEIGGAWKKQDKNNQSYISIGLANAFDKDKRPVMYKNKEGKESQRRGYVILDEIEYHELLKKLHNATGEVFPEIIPF